MVGEEKCRDIETTLKSHCGEGACPEWEVGEWSACSMTCGKGVRERAYWCRVGDAVTSTVVAASQCRGEEPVHEEACEGEPCLVWRAGPWGSCSTR